MVEYAGLIPLQPVDWGKVAQDAAKPITDVIQDRDQQRKDLEKISSDSLSLLQKYEENRAPNGAQFIMNASQQGRSYIMAQYELLTSGQITPEEFKRNTQNTRESFGMLNTYMKTYEADIQKAQERIDTGQASKMERRLTDHRSKIMDLAGKVSNFGNNGLMYITDDKGQVFDLQSLNMGINKQPLKVDLIAEVDKSVKGLGVGARMQDGKYVISQKLMGDWEKTKKSISKAIMDNPNKVASILADNSDEDYDFTFDPKEAGGLNILIETDPNGIMVAKPTPEQRAAAEEKLKVAIESRVSEEKKTPDNTKELEFKLRNRELDYKFKKLNMEAQEKEAPVYLRYQTLEDVSNGDVSSIIGKELTYSKASVKSGDKGLENKYKGYLVSGVKKQGNGYVVTAKSGTGKSKDFFYEPGGLLEDVNEVLNSTSGNDKVSGEKILQLYKDVGLSGATRAATPTAKGTVSGGKVR